MIHLEKEDGTNKYFVRNFGEGQLHLRAQIVRHNEFNFNFLTVQFT